MDKEDVYIYLMEHYSVIRKNKNAICSDMEGPRNCHLSEAISYILLIVVLYYIYSLQVFSPQSYFPANFYHKWVLNFVK